jgi:hypothetical protein
VSEPTRTEQLRARWGVREVDRRRWELEDRDPRPKRTPAATRSRTRRPAVRSVPRLSFFDMVSIVLADQEHRQRNRRMEIR